MAESEWRGWRAVAVVALVVSVFAVLGVERAATDWPAPDAPSYVQLAENLSGGDGYRVELAGEPEGSRYPPGFPILLALLSPFGDATTGTLLLAAGLVVASWAAAHRAGGPVAATVAALILAMYLPRHEYAGAVMADVTGALFVVLGLLAVQSQRWRLAGVLMGFGAWARLAHVALVVALRRRSWPAFGLLVAALAVTKVAWGWGYESGHAQWAASHVWSTAGLASPQAEAYPNLLAYPLMLLGVTGGLTVPGAAVLAGWAVWRRPERRFVLLTVAGLLAVFVPYFYQASRFMFPAVALIATYTGAGVADLVRSRREVGEGSGEVGAGGAGAVEHAPLVR